MREVAVKTRALTVAVVVLVVLCLPLAGVAGHGKTRVFIGGSVWLGPPAYGPAYYGPGWWGPAYGPPAYYVAPPPVLRQPPVYVERGQAEGDYWYYCENPRGYHPYVRSCPGGWMKVVPDTVPPNR